MTEKITLPLVVIQWNDHNSDDDWVNHKEAKERATPMIMSSVGWLVNETDEIYQIASTFSHADNNLSMMMNIVKSAVVKTTNIPQPKRRKRRV